MHTEPRPWTTSRARLAAGLAILLVAVLAPMLIARSPAHAATTNGTFATTLGSKRVEFTFNKNGDTSQIKQAIRLISNAPAGSTIRMGIYSVDRSDVVNAVKAAVKKGVNVYIVHSGEKKNEKDAKGNAARALLTAVKADHFHWCLHGDAAHAGCISHSVGLMHAKYMLFSSTKDSAGNARSSVVWYSSGNFTTASGVNKYNNSTTIYGDSDLYGGFISDVWNAQWDPSNWADNDYYDADKNRGYFGSSDSNSQVYVSPEQDTDLVDNRLAYIDGGSGCEVRVMQAWLRDSRIKVVNRLVALKRSGCAVSVVAEIIESAAWNKLHAAGIPMKKNTAVHDKAFIIKAKYNDSSALRTVVLNGSENLSGPALTSNDELLVKLTDDATMYSKFVAHFSDAYSSGSTMTKPTPGQDPSDSDGS